MNTPQVPTVRLNAGISMPQMGFGSWPLERRAAECATGAAIEAGYRLIDTASSYGNERAVGNAIRSCGLSREEMFLTTKLHGEDHGFHSALRAFDASLNELRMDYVDLYLIHWPLPSLNLYVETWRAFQKLHSEGRVRAIGVSNFKPSHLNRIAAETGAVPSVNQIQLHPRISQRHLRRHHQDMGIVTQSWSPLDRGSDILSTPEIRTLATKYGKTPAQIILRWHIQLGLSIVPNSSHPSRIAENLDIFNFSFTPREVQSIAALDTGEELPIDSDLTQPGLRLPHPRGRSQT